MTTKINSIGISSAKENYLSYSDTDSSTDYFNGRNVNMRSTIELLKKDGANVIQVYSDGSQEETEIAKYLNRAAKIAKGAGYINNVIKKARYNEQDGIRHEWVEVSGTFVKEGVVA